MILKKQNKNRNKMKKLLYTFIFLAACLMTSCGCKEKKEQVEGVDSLEHSDAFSAEALADIVEYQRQKSGEGTEYNPWASYGLLELVDVDDADEEDFEYIDEEEVAESDEAYDEYGDEEYEQIPDASDDYEAASMTYFLGHNVKFDSSRHDVTAFSKQADDAVGVIDRFDDEGSQIDILIYNKELYDDFMKKSKDTVRYQDLGGNRFLSKGDSLASPVTVCFEGSANGGYLISILSE